MLKTDIYIKELFELLSIPSISAQSKRKKDINKACLFLKRKLESLKFKAETLPTGGHPVVYAEAISAKTKGPTLLIYGHYDVQSPDPLDEWTSDPFKPEIRSGNIYARGAADDKGQLYTWIAAIEELLHHNTKRSSSLNVNIKFLIEGEEEVGSKNLEEFVNQNKSLLAADICLISDTPSLSENQPVITCGLRGIVYFELLVKTLEKDIHSGIYGGNVLNPINVLSQIISELKDDEHKVSIPNFYKNVRKLTKSEEKEITKFPFGEDEIKQETGAKVAAGLKNCAAQIRKGAMPTLDVNGIWGGYQDEGIKTIIPAQAGAKISMRIVPKQTSDEIAERFEKYVKSITPEGVDLRIKRLDGAEPIIIDKSSKFFKTAETAFEKVFGKKPLYHLEGGSIPVTAIFKNVLEIDSILMGYGLPDDGNHSPNEKLSLSMFEKGIRTNIEFLKKL